MIFQNPIKSTFPHILFYAPVLVQGVGILLAVWILSKLNRINKNVDKQYLRLKQYLAAQK
ncbi:hypothetical protein [Streptococcus sp.]|uniref:hypothetical protein n=1 Tax=Streptococcus sp. TaxID=1306 RepID=UPI00391CBD93